MKVIKAEFKVGEFVLHLYGAYGIGTGSYEDEHWIMPVDDNADQMGFTITDKVNEDAPGMREWVKTLITSTLSTSESETTALEYLRWYFRTLIESIMFKHHVTIDNNLYSEILLYEEIERYVNYTINSCRTDEEPDIQPTES